MLPYATLLLASLGALLAVTLIYKTMRMIHRSISKSRSPSSNVSKHAAVKRPTSVHSKKSTINSAVEDSLAPLERRNHKTSWNQPKVNAADSNASRNQDFAWLKREKTSVLSENSYTVKRRVTPKAKTLESVSKPYRRKVAPWVLEYGSQNKASTPTTGAK